MINTSKHTIYLIIFLIISATFTSCLSIAKYKSKTGMSDRADVKNYSERTFTSQEIAALKNTTTVFFLRESDMELKSEFEKAIKSSWNYTDIEVAAYKDLNNYLDGNYSFFIVEGYVTTYTSESGQDSKNAQFYLTLAISENEKNRRGNTATKKINFCRIELYLEFRSITSLSINTKTSINRFYGKNTKVFNWTPGKIKLYLEDIQKNLEENKREWLFQNMKNKTTLSKLKEDTLYISENVLIKFAIYTGKEHKRHNPEKLLRGYPYPHKILSSEDLSRMILTDHDMFVFDYVKSGTDKHLIVYHTKTGKVYKKYKSLAYNLKPKDLKRLSRSIK